MFDIIDNCTSININMLKENTELRNNSENRRALFNKLFNMIHNRDIKTHHYSQVVEFIRTLDTDADTKEEVVKFEKGDIGETCVDVMQDLDKGKEDAIKFAMQQLADVRTGSDDEVLCHNSGVLLGHAFGIYAEDGDKELAQDLIEMNYPNLLD